MINTHTHLDYTPGNCVVALLGAALISHEAERKYLVEQGTSILNHAADYGLKPEEMAGTEIALPTLTFRERLTIDLGDEEAQLIRVAPSHPAGSLVVYLPAKKLMFSGDVLFTDFHPYLGDGDIAGWMNTIDSLLKMDMERIVPGHGPLSVKKDLVEMEAYLLLFDAKERELSVASQDVDAISAQMLNILPKRSMAEWMVGTNLKLRYLKK